MHYSTSARQRASTVPCSRAQCCGVFSKPCGGGRVNTIAVAAHSAACWCAAALGAAIIKRMNKQSWPFHQDSPPPRKKTRTRKGGEWVTLLSFFPSVGNCLLLGLLSQFGCESFCCILCFKKSYDYITIVGQAFLQKSSHFSSFLWEWRLNQFICCARLYYMSRTVRDLFLRISVHYCLK